MLGNELSGCNSIIQPIPFLAKASLYLKLKPPHKWDGNNFDTLIIAIDFSQRLK